MTGLSQCLGELHASRPLGPLAGRRIMLYYAISTSYVASTWAVVGYCECAPAVFSIASFDILHTPIQSQIPNPTPPEKRFPLHRILFAGDLQSLPISAAAR